MNILIRDVPDPIVARLDAEAAASRQSRQEFLVGHLERFFGEPAVVLGYVAIDRRGDLDADASCPECGQPLTRPYLWFAANGAYGVVCDACATSD